MVHEYTAHACLYVTILVYSVKPGSHYAMPCKIIVSDWLTARGYVFRYIPYGTHGILHVGGVTPGAYAHFIQLLNARLPVGIQLYKIKLYDPEIF